MRLPLPLIGLADCITWATAARPILSVWNHAGILGSQFMTTNAVGRLGNRAALYVFTIGYWLKVIWVHAPSHPTKMVDNQTTGNTAVIPLVTPAVGQNGVPFSAKRSVTPLIQCALPQPTARFVFLVKNFWISGSCPAAFRPNRELRLPPSLPVHKAHAASLVWTGAIDGGTESFHEPSIHQNEPWYDSVSSRWRAF